MFDVVNHMYVRLVCKNVESFFSKCLILTSGIYWFLRKSFCMTIFLSTLLMPLSMNLSHFTLEVFNSCRKWEEVLATLWGVKIYP